MSVPQWAWEVARRFWAEAGGWTPAADLAAAIGCTAMIVRIDTMAGLTTCRVRDFLARHGKATPQGLPERLLRGCLLASEEVGWILLDANDPGDERRYTLAHEIAHFLRHHLQQHRFTAGGSAGRLRAALRGVRLVDYLHLMDRRAGFVSPEVREAEEEADWLAVELLVPEEELAKHVGPKAGRGEMEAVLRGVFGLPESAAKVHAARLVPEKYECPLIARLKKR